MTDAGHAANVWTDRSFLRHVQYRTDVNLAARQSIYTYQEPPTDLARGILSLAGLSGRELVADIGCGNGLYLAELARRGHAGPMAGVDLSPGMLHAARRRTPQAGLVVADATALPFREAAAARLPDPEPLVEAVANRLRAAPGAVFRVTTHSGCLVCA
jgi:SAM-dependent methyltransferase